MAINSKQKGKRGELAAAKFLRSLGFASARRGQQHRGGADSPDVEAKKELSRVHIEVKFNVQGMDLGTALFNQAWDQAVEEAGNKCPVLLWKRGRYWRATALCPMGLSSQPPVLATFHIGHEIKRLLQCADSQAATDDRREHDEDGGQDADASDER